jgi:hypothetical protein
MAKYKPAPGGETLTVVYIGPQPGVIVAATGTLCLRGVPVSLPCDIAEGLLCQQTWQKPSTAETVGAVTDPDKEQP